jgi:hypothetical protein
MKPKLQGGGGGTKRDAAKRLAPQNTAVNGCRFPVQTQTPLGPPGRTEVITSWGYCEPEQTTPSSLFPECPVECCAARTQSCSPPPPHTPPPSLFSSASYACSISSSSERLVCVSAFSPSAAACPPTPSAPMPAHTRETSRCKVVWTLCTPAAA